MPVSEISRRVYRELLESGAMSAQRALLYEAFLESERAVTHRELCAELELETNTSGTVKWLRDAGLVRIVTERPCDITGRIVAAYEAHPSPEPNIDYANEQASTSARRDAKIQRLERELERWKESALAAWALLGVRP